MSNSFFQFKQFIIQQDKCAMKVCTDACILGAWTADKFGYSAIKNILDIGCGTGLLSLMFAQNKAAATDAIEINKDAAEQATENVARSPWAKDIAVIHTSLHDFIPGKKYDLIICNPPFYEDDLRSADEHKNAAMHDTSLRLEELILFVKEYLSDDGAFVLLLPFRRTAYFEGIANEHGLFVQEKLLIKQSPQHSYFRSILLLSKKEMREKTNELIIHDNERDYTAEFKNLMREYYLKL